jgi:hypothetical protein
MVLPTFLVDGFVRGVWKVERTAAGGAVLVIQPFETLEDKVAQELCEEGERLMRWVLEKITTFEVKIVAYDGTLRGQNMWGRL